MAESELHKRVSRSLRVGDDVGQSFGESLKVADALPPNTAIRKGPAQGLRPDHRIMTTEGVLVAVEYRYRHPIPQEKLNRLMAEGMPILEIDLRDLTGKPTESEIREYLAQEGGRVNDRSKRFLYMPTIDDIIRRAGGSTEQGPGHNYGGLRCLVPGCRGEVANAHSGVFVDPQMALGEEPWAYDRLLRERRIRSYTLPRFACVDHIGLPAMYATPGGLNWYRTPATPNSARIGYGQTTRDIGGGLRAMVKIQTGIHGPPG